MRIAALTLLLLSVLAAQPTGLNAEKADTPDQGSLPPDATRCGVSVPIGIELVPLDELQVGQTARFEARIDSDIDPALVRRMWVDYEFSDKLRAASGFSTRHEILNKKGRQLRQIAFVIPDRQRHRIRARVKVELVDGSMMARTAVRYVDLGNNPPDGMIGRLVDPDGTVIRIYAGQSAGK